MLVYKRELSPDVILGLWHMDSEISWENCPKTICQSIVKTCARRQMEVTSAYSLLRSMIGDNESVIRHDSSGKPIVEGWNISISHTRCYVAIILSRSRTVAVDIEYISSRVERVAGKFMRSNETASDFRSLLIHWCAKETMYKYFSEQHLAFENMRVRPFVLSSFGVIEVLNLRDTKVLDIHYECNDDFVITWAG